MFNETPISDIARRASDIDATRVFIEVSDGQVTQRVKELNIMQLMAGRDASGVRGELLSDIGGGYSDLTLELNPNKSRLIVTLRDTGEYHSSIRVSVNADGYTIEGDHFKEDFGRLTDLTERWGKNIEGLNEISITELSNLLVEKYVNYLHTKVF